MPKRGNPCIAFLNRAVSVIFEASFQNKMTGGAPEVTEGDLCLHSLEKPGT